MVVTVDGGVLSLPVVEAGDALVLKHSLGRAHMAGSSNGGSIGLGQASRRPELVRSLGRALVDPLAGTRRS